MKVIRRLKRLFQLSLLMAVLSYTHAGHAQPEHEQTTAIQVLDAERALLWEKIEDTDEAVKRLLQQSGDARAITSLLSPDCEGLSSPEQMKVASLHAEADALSDDKGLELRGGYTLGSQSSDIDDDEGEAYLELNWNVLREGYQARQDKATAMRNHAEAMRLKGEMEHHKRVNRCRRLGITNTFATLRSALLSTKLELMEPVFEVERRAYFKGWSFLDDLLVSEGDIHGVRQSLQRLNLPELLDRGQILRNSFNPPVIDVDLAAVIRAIESDDSGLLLRNAKRLAAQYDAKANGQRDRLRFFVRKSFSHGDGGLNDDGVAAGVRFIMPLSRKTKTALDYELKSIDDDYELGSWRRVARTRAVYVELHEQLERVTEQQFRYLRASERLRRSVVGKDVSLAATEIATAVIRARTLLDASLELVKAKEELYQRVNEVFLQAQMDFDPSFIKVLSLPDGKYRARAGHRSLYLWSGTFNVHSNKRLWQFIDSKGVNSVMLSAGRKTDKDKLERFISRARKKNIDVGLMVGANEWIFDKNREQALLKSAVTAERTGHLHLDIEPHTLAGYKANRRAYLDAYIDVIEAIRKIMAPEDKLSISVPVHWDQQDYVRLNGIVDELYLMAYETPAFTRLERRLEPILEVIPSERITVALRPQDFADEWELEQTILKIMDRFGVRRVALHDAKTYMAMPVTE